MADFGPWRYYVYEKKGRLYLRRQRGRRVPGRRDPEKQYEHLGPVVGDWSNYSDSERSAINTAVMLLVSNRDEYDRPYPSLYNHLKDKTAEMRQKADALGATLGAAAKFLAEGESEQPPDEREAVDEGAAGGQGEPLAREAGPDSSSGQGDPPNTETEGQSPASSENL